MSISLGSLQNPYMQIPNQIVPNNTDTSANLGVSINTDNKPVAKANEFSDPEVRASKRTGRIECQTCKNRTYQDGSNDPGVSFKTPGHIDPSSAASVVMAHEQEHVKNETAKASSENRKVVSQSVTLQTSVCAECGRNYVSGGETRTVTKSEASKEPTDYFIDNFKKLMTKSFGKSIDIKV